MLVHVQGHVQVQESFPLPWDLENRSEFLQETHTITNIPMSLRTEKTQNTMLALIWIDIHDKNIVFLYSKAATWEKSLGYSKNVLESI